MPDFSSMTAHLPDNLADALVYIAIGVVTLIGVIKCLLPLWNTTHALRRAVSRLQADAGRQQGEKPVWQESRFMGKRLRGSWLRFLQNAEQLDRRGLPCNVEDYINDDTVTHGPGNATLAELIPGLLTSLGILGTFMGMMRGLGGLDFSDAANIIAGIPKLLTGMQFAFGTSIAGISCSLCFNMLNRIAQGSSYRAIDDFVSSFTQLAMQRPLDNDVQLICQNQDCNHLLNTVTESLPGQIAGSVELSVTRAMQPVARAMDNFLVGATRAQIDGVNKIVNNFISRMNETLSGQFLTLGQTMTELNQHQSAAAAQVEQSMQTASAVLNDATRLSGVSGDVIARFEQYVKELGDARRRDERFEQATSELLSKLHNVADQQNAALRGLKAYQDDLYRALQQFQEKSQETMTALGRVGSESAVGLSSASQAMQTAGEALSRSYDTFVQNVVEGLSRSLGLFDESMHSLISTLSEQIDALNAHNSEAVTAKQVSELQRMLTAISDSVQRAADTLDAVKEE